MYRFALAVIGVALISFCLSRIVSKFYLQTVSDDSSQTAIKNTVTRTLYIIPVLGVIASVYLLYPADSIFALLDITVDSKYVTYTSDRIIQLCSILVAAVAARTGIHSTKPGKSNSQLGVGYLLATGFALIVISSGLFTAIEPRFGALTALASVSLLLGILFWVFYPNLLSNYSRDPTDSEEEKILSMCDELDVDVDHIKITSSESTGVPAYLISRFRSWLFIQESTLEASENVTMVSIVYAKGKTQNGVTNRVFFALLSLTLSGILLIASFRGLSGNGSLQTIIPEISVAFALIGVAIFSAWSAVRGIDSATEFAAEELGTNTVADAFKEHRFLEPIEELALSLRNRGSTSGEHKLRVLTELDDGISGESEK